MPPLYAFTLSALPLSQWLGIDQLNLLSATNRAPWHVPPEP